MENDYYSQCRDVRAAFWPKNENREVLFFWTPACFVLKEINFLTSISLLISELEKHFIIGLCRLINKSPGVFWIVAFLFFWNHKSCLIKRMVAVLKIKSKCTSLFILALYSEVPAWLCFKGWVLGFEWLYNKSKKQQELGGILNMSKATDAGTQLC